MELRFLMLIWVIILMKILLARENNIKQNENKNKMLNRLSFLSENDDPQKYKGMMEKIDITATGVVDSIRNKMAVATVSNKD